jgi:hypothetical protein
MDPYLYQNIAGALGSKSIRVLKLAPGLPSDPLHGSLSLENLNDGLKFEAVSYAWGRAAGHGTISCDGKPIRITTSLATALVKLRYPSEERIIWVDQVCINQKDLAERNQQIRHMNWIYRKASKVLVWLGEDQSGQAHHAFDLVSALSVIAADSTLSAGFKEKKEEVNGWFPEHYWHALSAMLRLTWVSKHLELQQTILLIICIL